MFNIEKIATSAPFCFSCLGRVVGRVGFGLDNRERGLEMINHLESVDASLTESNLICSSEKCKICDGLIGEVDNFIEIVCLWCIPGAAGAPEKFHASFKLLGWTLYHL